ncbi:universal stress protein [Streptomyces sp. SP17BM10]|uniref:universal stress protein n=1 Tax=Streptomyces sp. SP17BM10 TaxID=3002530 RepID=UPI002E7964FB|nr:universal stress protein [Streptomyces sp. SP17BM10]MEE1786679.1 universal stress protein [Streptomyces sp. SP17BM10]
MTPPVVVGFDGSPESLAATEWAVREAQRRACPLTLLQAWPWPRRDVVGSDETYLRSVARLSAREAELRALELDVPIGSAHVRAEAVEALEEAARSAAVLVLGSRGLGTVHGYLTGSVSQEVLGRAACPVVLVRAGEGEGDAAVVVGLDLAHPADEVLAFAFEAASVRGAPLRVIHAWEPPAFRDYLTFDAIGGLETDFSEAERDRFTAIVDPWRARHPDVDATSEPILGNASAVLVAAAGTARLLVLGRRTRHHPLGSRLGAVAHAVIHHARCPVAVVPHG